MSMQDAATYLRVTTRTVRTMVLDGRLKAYQLGPRVIRFRRSEIDAALTPINVQLAAIGTPHALAARLLLAELTYDDDARSRVSIDIQR